MSSSSKKKKRPPRSRKINSPRSYVTGNAGRRPIICQAIIDDLCEVISAGNYDDTAIAYVGISSSGFYKWMRRGEDEIDRVQQLLDAGEDAEVSDSEEIYVRLVESIKKARAAAEVHAVGVVTSHFADSWQAGMTFLERRYRDRWRRSDRYEHTGPEGGAIVNEVRRVIIDDLGDAGEDS